MKIENVETMGLHSSIKASKYPMAINTDSCNELITDRVNSLAKSDKGEGHDQFLTGIVVNFDLTFSNKAWVELERYKFINFVSSQSTMHCIRKLDIKKQCNKYVWNSTINELREKIKAYNKLIEYQKATPLESNRYIEISNALKELYLEILYNIPSGFELTARLSANYRALKTVYSQRRTHRLPCWQGFCDWIETLEFSELITGK